MPKKSKKPIPEKTQRRINVAQELTFLIAFGRKYDRIKVGDELITIDIVDNRCYNCLSEVKLLHCIGCLCEWMLCCGQLAEKCNCSFFTPEEDK